MHVISTDDSLHYCCVGLQNHKQSNYIIYFSFDFKLFTHNSVLNMLCETLSNRMEVRRVRKVDDQLQFSDFMAQINYLTLLGHVSA